MSRPEDFFTPWSDDEEDLIGPVESPLPQHKIAEQIASLDDYHRGATVHALLERLSEDEALKAARDLFSIHPRAALFTNTKYNTGSARRAFDLAEEEYRVALRHEAARNHQKSLLPDTDPPSATSLSALLDERDEPVAYRVDELWPVDGKVVLAAQNKSGKTTLVNNAIRCLVDGARFLGQFATEAVGRVVLIDDELSRNMVRSWLRRQHITNTDAVDVFSLRGNLSSFDVLDPATRSEWAARIGPADVLVFDCLRPALDALGLSEDKDAGRFLVALDELCRQAGIREVLVVHHMGHSNERARGDSRIEDWPDAKWQLVKADPDDPDSQRFFKAYGRDVNQAEVGLAFDPETNLLSVVGGSRRAMTNDRILNGVQCFVADNPGCSASAIKRGVSGDNSLIDAAIRDLENDGWLVVDRKGPGKPSQHYPGPGPAGLAFSEPLDSEN